MENSEHVPRDGIEPRAVSKRSIDVRNERKQRLVGRVERSGCAKELGVDLQQPPWLLVCRPSHHDTIQPLCLSERLLDAGKPAVEYDLEIQDAQP